MFVKPFDHCKKLTRRFYTTWSNLTQNGINYDFTFDVNQTLTEDFVKECFTAIQAKFDYKGQFYISPIIELHDMQYRTLTMMQLVDFAEQEETENIIKFIYHRYEKLLYRYNNDNFIVQALILRLWEAG